MQDAEVRIVGLGLALEGLWEQQPRVLLAAPARTDEELPALTDALAGALGQARRVVAVLPEWTGEDAWRRLQTVHALLDTDRLALHRTELPPLAAGVAAALTAALVPRLPSAGAVPATLDAVGQELVVLAWLGRVNGLRRPAPSIAQHARSALPGASFLAGLQPDAFVHALSAEQAELPVGRGRQAMELLMAPHPAGDVDWVVDVANPALGGLRLREIDPVADGPAWWGTDRLVELVAYPTDLAALAARTVPRDLQPCRWCGERIPEGPCPFCGERDGRPA